MHLTGVVGDKVILISTPKKNHLSVALKWRVDAIKYRPFFLLLLAILILFCVKWNDIFALITSVMKVQKV